MFANLRGRGCRSFSSDRIVFVCGAGCSGTTLTADLLGMHSEIAPLYETDFITDIAKGIWQLQMLEYDGRISRSAATCELQSAALSIVKQWLQREREDNYWSEKGPNERYFHGTRYLGVLSEQFFDSLLPLAERFCESLEDGMDSLQALAGFCDELFSEHARREGRRVVVNKTPSYGEVLPVLAAAYPGAKVLHCIRDGRDVACSIVQRPFGPSDIRETGPWWAGRVQGAVDWGRAHPDVYKEVRHERLVRASLGELSRVLGFLGLPDEAESMLRRYKRGVAIDRGRSGVWRNLSEQELWSFGTHAGRLLDDLGYISQSGSKRRNPGEGQVEVCVRHCDLGTELRVAVAAESTMLDVKAAAAREAGNDAILLRGSIVRRIGEELREFPDDELVGKRRVLLFSGPGFEPAAEAPRAAGPKPRAPLLDAQSGAAALHVAAFHGDIGSVASLCEAGASADEACCLEAVPTFEAFGRVLALMQTACKGGHEPWLNEVTPLFVAAFSGHLQVVRHLCTSRASPDRQVQAGITPLTVAALKGHLDVVRCLGQCGASRGRVTEHGHTLLHWSAMSDSAPLVRHLCQRYDKDQPNHAGATPSHVAAFHGHADVLRCLQDAGADLGAANAAGDSPLHVAARAGHAEALAFLLEAGGDVHGPSREGALPTHFAAAAGHVEALQCLLGSGAEVHAQWSGSGHTPLHAAAQHGHAQALSCLLDASADPGRRSRDGSTALHAAAAHGHAEALWCLLDAGGSRDCTQDDGSTPMHVAASFGHASAVQCLADSSADMEALSHSGCTPLLCAVFRGHVEAARCLCALGADLDAAYPDGTTALVSAASDGNVELMDCLCAAGADVDKAGQGGDTPLHVAAIAGHLEAVSFLCQVGADREKLNRFGSTAGSSASFLGKLDVAQFLDVVGRQLED